MEPSIAIYSFDDPFIKHENESLGRAVAIELVHHLSNHPGIRVVSYISTHNSDGENPNVNYHLQGSIFRSENQISVTYQLIDPQSSLVIHSEKIEESINNFFNLVNRTSRKIIEYLVFELPTSRIATPIDNEAYENYLKGLRFWNLWSENNITAAIQHFEKAVEIEPEFALGFARLSGCLAMLAAIQKGGEVRGNYSRAKAAALRAISIDDHLIEAHNSLAIIKLLNDVDVLGAFYSLKKALSLN